MSSVRKPVVGPPEKVFAVQNNFERLFEASGSSEKFYDERGEREHGSGVASSLVAPVFKSPASRVIYKPSPQAKIIEAMRLKKASGQLMSPQPSPVKQVVSKATSSPTVPGVPDGLSRSPLRRAAEKDDNKENTSSQVDGEDRPTPSVDQFDSQQHKSKDQGSQNDPGPGSPASKEPRGKGKRDSLAKRKEKVMNWLETNEKLLHHHQPDDLVITPPSTGQVSDSGISSRLADDTMAATGDTNPQSQEDETMSEEESDGDTVKMNDTDGTITEKEHGEQLRTQESSVEDNAGIIPYLGYEEEGVARDAEEEKMETGEDNHGNMSEEDMDQEIEQPTNEKLSLSIAWTDNMDNMSVDTTDTSKQQEIGAAPKVKNAAVKPFKEHILYNWFIRPVKKSTAIVVEGHRKQDPEYQYWHSTVITKRLTSRMVVTGSGTVYRLRGLVDRPMVLEQGFPASVARAFKNGFPEHWEEVLETCHDNPSKKQAADQQRGNKQDTSYSKKVSRRESPAAKNTVSAAPPSPQGILGSLARSRSGRVVKPRMAWWANQKVIVEDNSVKVLCRSVDKLPQSPAILSVKSGNNLDIVVNREELQDSRCVTPSTVVRRPATVVRRPPKVAVGDPPSTSVRDPPDGSDHPDPEATLPPAKKKTRLEPQGHADTTIPADILSDTPRVSKGGTSVTVVQNRRQLRKTGNRQRQDVPEDILNTPKPAHTFKIPETEAENTDKDEDLSPAGRTHPTTMQKKSKVHASDSEDSRNGKASENKQKRSRSRGDGGRSVADSSSEKQFSTEEHPPVPVQKKTRRGRRKNEAPISNMKKAKEDTSNTTSSSSLITKGENSANAEVPSDDTEPKQRKQAPSKRNSRRDEEAETEEIDNGPTQSTGRGRRAKKQSSTSQQSTAGLRRSQRVKDVATSECEEPAEDNPAGRRGKRRGELSGKTSTALRSSSRKRQAEGRLDGTELESDSQNFGKSEQNEGRRRGTRSQTKKKATNKKTEDEEHIPATQVHEDKEKNENSPEKSSRKKGKNKKPPEDTEGRQRKEQNNEVLDKSWTVDEDKRLYRAISSISVEEPSMWQKIAEMVGNRTAEECQDRYQEMARATEPSKPKNKEVSNMGEKEPKKPVILTGKAGTLKRKRQLQELIQQYNEGHEDEAFEDSVTPFKRQKKISKGLISTNYNADEDDDVCTNVTSRQAFQTPMSRFSGHSSAAEPTPKGLSLRTPGVIGEEVHKSNLDKYVFHQQKAKKGRTLNTGPKKMLGGQQGGRKTKVPNIDFSKLLKAQPIQDDDSDEGDDYFSDHED